MLLLKCSAHYLSNCLNYILSNNLSNCLSDYSNENPSCRFREKLQKTFFLENGITEDKMSLRTSALAHLIQNKLYLQYIFIILL